MIQSFLTAAWLRCPTLRALATTFTLATAALGDDPLAQFVPGVTINEFFGGAVAVSGTLLAVGSPQNADAGNLSGIVRIYDLAGATPLVPILTLSDPTPVTGERFGTAVAMSGTRVVVGGYDSTGPTLAGIVHVFDLAGATPTAPIATFTNPTPEMSDYFGNAVAISGTLVAVGEYNNTVTVDNAGSVYVYDLASATPTVPLVTIDNPTPATNDFFGSSVGLSGTRVAIGAGGDDTDANGAGSAYLYDVATATLLRLPNPAPAINDFFGSKVAISGTRIVVSANFDDAGASDAGTVYGFDLASATPAVPVATLFNPTPVAAEFFGSAVAISGARVVVGKPFGDNPAADAGSTYVYDLTGLDPATPTLVLHNPAPVETAAGDRYGLAVALDLTMVAIGAPSGAGAFATSGFVQTFSNLTRDADGDGLLDAWELLYWPSLDTQGPNDDPDGDGRTALEELAYGLHPLVPDAELAPRPAIEGGYLTITLPKRAGATYEVQTAGTPFAGQPDSFSTAATVVLIDDLTTLKVRDNPPGPALFRYLRVRVQTAP